MNPEPSIWKNRILNITTISSIIVFLTLSFLGNHGSTFMSNDKCYALLGCNIGFFGYDVMVHFISGIMEASLIILLMKKFLSFNLFHESFWKNLLVVVSLVALIAFSWEFGELCHDQFRVKVLHENLINPNNLDQPTSNDTMGDMTFSILGATITAFALRSFMKKKKVDNNR